MTKIEFLEKAVELIKDAQSRGLSYDICLYSNHPMEHLTIYGMGWNTFPMFMFKPSTENWNEKYQTFLDELREIQNLLA